jgi:hypothetical protein
MLCLPMDLYISPQRVAQRFASEERRHAVGGRRDDQQSSGGGDDIAERTRRWHFGTWSAREPDCRPKPTRSSRSLPRRRSVGRSVARASVDPAGPTPTKQFIDMVRPLPQAKWVVIYSFADGGRYYDAMRTTSGTCSTIESR